MKVIYIANSFIPSKTANSIHVMKMCQSMAGLGHTVTLVTFDAKQDEEQGIDDIYAYYGVKPTFKIKKIKLRTLKGKMHMFALEAIKYAKSQAPDLVYTRCEIPAVYLSYTTLPFIVEAHKPFINKGGLLKLLFKRLFLARNLKRFIAISKALERMFLQHFKHNSFDAMVLHDAADKIETAKAGHVKWKGRPEALQAGYFGHLYQGRGIELIIEAAKHLPEVDFQIIGGREQDVKYWQEQLGDQNNLFLYGFVKPSEVQYYRSRCDVLLAPYQREVWVADKSHESSRYMSPLKIFEYMSSHRCIICSDMPVLREVLNHKNAVLVTPDKVKEWVEAIRRCNDKSYRETLADEAYSSFEQNYTWDKRAEAALKGIV